MCIGKQTILLRGDPEAHQEDTPRAVELAAVNGRIETFATLAAHLQIDSDDEWFQLAQVYFVIHFCVFHTL